MKATFECKTLFFAKSYLSVQDQKRSFDLRWAFWAIWRPLKFCSIFSIFSIPCLELKPLILSPNSQWFHFPVSYFSPSIEHAGVEIYDQSIIGRYDSQILDSYSNYAYSRVLFYQEFKVTNENRGQGAHAPGVQLSEGRKLGEKKK